MWVDKRLPRLHERLVFAPTHGIERRGGHGRRRVAPTARSARILGKPEMLNPNENRVRWRRRRHLSALGAMIPRGRVVLVLLALSITSAHAQRWVRLAREADFTND